MTAGPPAGDLPDLLAELRSLAAVRPTGSRLPPERELTVRLGVGRALLRRALRELAHPGTIPLVMLQPPQDDSGASATSSADEEVPATITCRTSWVTRRVDIAWHRHAEHPARREAVYSRHPGPLAAFPDPGRGTRGR